MKEREEKQVDYRDIFHQVEYMKMMIAALINRFGDSIDAIASAWMLVITTLIISTVEAFRVLANSALLPKVLEKEYYEYGMSLSSTLRLYNKQLFS